MSLLTVTVFAELEMSIKGSGSPVTVRSWVAAGSSWADGTGSSWADGTGSSWAADSFVSLTAGRLSKGGF